MWLYEKQRDPTVTGSHAADVSLTGLACFALGAAAMYFFDPLSGQERREALAERFRTAAGRTSESMSGAGRYVRDRATTAAGYVRDQAETIAGSARAAVGAAGTNPGSMAENDNLRNRVREELATVSSSASDISVDVEGGVVTLRGNLPAGEIDGLLNVVNNIPGVRQLENRLHPVEYSADDSAGNAGSTRTTL